MSGSAASASSASGRFGRLCLGTIAGIKPPFTLQAESGRRNHFLHRAAALGAFTGWRIGKFLSQLELMIACNTAVLVHGHVYYVLLIDNYVFNYTDSNHGLSMLVGPHPFKKTTKAPLPPISRGAESNSDTSSLPASRSQAATACCRTGSAGELFPLPVMTSAAFSP